MALKPQALAQSPPIVAVPPPLQSVARASVAQGPVQPAIVQPVAIRIAQGGKPLWSGTLSIGGAGQTRLSLSEPVDMPAGCSTAFEGRNGRQIDLTISSRRYGAAEQGGFQLSLRYSRPSPEAPCPTGTRGSTIEQSFSLGRGAVSFEGDGDLKVTIQPQ
ncbi:MAG: hypothetical protein QHC40_13595 [Sphingobium sp.]|nr:hypothetical protein [Sphingobium sp.]